MSFRFRLKLSPEMLAVGLVCTMAYALSTGPVMMARASSSSIYPEKVAALFSLVSDVKQSFSTALYLSPSQSLRFSSRQDLVSNSFLVTLPTVSTSPQQSPRPEPVTDVQWLSRITTILEAGFALTIFTLSVMCVLMFRTR